MAPHVFSNVLHITRRNTMGSSPSITLCSACVRRRELVSAHPRNALFKLYMKYNTKDKLAEVSLVEAFCGISRRHHLIRGHFATRS